MRLRTLWSALATLALSASSASAAPFGAPYSLDLTGSTPLASAIDAGGAAVVGDVRGTAGKRRVEVALRGRAGATWTTATLGAEVSEARDVQTVIGGRGVVVAWAEATRDHQSLVVATGRAGGPLAVRWRLTVVDAFAASPRLARLRGGAVVLAWRDGRSGSRSRVRVATIDGDRFSSAPRTVGTDVAQVVLAARGAGAAVGWTSAYRGRVRKTRLSVPRARPRPFTIRTLDARGLPSGRPTVVARDVDRTVRLAGAPDGRLVASWLRPQKIRPYPGEARGDGPPPSAYINPVAFTRQLLPRALPARPVGGADRFPASTPTVAFDAAGQAVAALRVTSSNMIPAYDIVASTSRAGNAWSAPRLIAAVGFSRFDPVAVAPDAGDVVIVHTALIPASGQPAWTVAAADVTGPHLLGTTSAGDGRGIAVARASGRILVAWPLGGVVQVAERG